MGEHMAPPPRSRLTPDQTTRISALVALTEEKKRPHAWSRLTRVVGTFLLSIVALAVVIVLLLFAADWSVRHEALDPADPPPAALPTYVTLQSDERLFTLMAALNAAGYNDENNSKGMHPVRQAVRKRLAAMNLPVVAWLRLQFQAHQSLYVNWLFQRGSAPDFKREAAGWWIETAPPFLFWNLDSALREFYREADIADLWKEFKPQYDAEDARYQALAAPAVRQVLTYLRIKNPPTGHVVVEPNLLDAYWRGYGPRVGDTSYVVMGPADQPNIGLIQHEAMHPIINPMVEESMEVIDGTQSGRLFEMLETRVPAGYTTWDGILQESVIRAVEVRLLEPRQRESQIEQEEKQGFMLVRPLEQQLTAYEKSGKTFGEYLPTLLSTLNGFAFK